MDMRSIYRKIAKQNGVSIKEVKDEMQNALDDAWSNPNKSFDVRFNQMKASPNGTKPTVDEFIRYCSAEVKKK